MQTKNCCWHGLQECPGCCVCEPFEHEAKEMRKAIIVAKKALLEAGAIIGPMRETPAVSRFLTLYSDFLERVRDK